LPENPANIILSGQIGLIINGWITAMNNEQSIVKKTETALDDLRDLWGRRNFVCIVVLFVVLFPTFFIIYQQVVSVPKLKSNINKLETQKNEAEKKRDKAEIQLAPFLAAAELRFPDSPENEKLDLLLLRLDKAINDVQKAAQKISPERTINPKLKISLLSNLKAIPALDVEIMCVMSDAEGFSLASQLKEVFEQAGWEVHGVNQGVFTKPIKHLVLNFGKEPSQELKRTLAPLLDSFGYPRKVGLDKKLKENSMKIIVGGK